jgi:hypothetical protein
MDVRRNSTALAAYPLMRGRAYATALARKSALRFAARRIFAPIH